ncbi:GTP cyclohydrolase [Robiginitalea sp. M366]|uniref:GTP cyclohydrolase n=1 Tax=Robiginitalea aestuariiviva TaxID=3036903 RepID=UPI00240D3665|nr:GTP cyclohydrolase [Robiginitalea aestuariiviva]MDG1573038.1 GTP cyclohydrolase [Robiginitalea aestuariiviva]
MIQIREARSNQDMKAFVRFPFRLYAGSPYWVPPIIRDELQTLDAKVNPVFEQAEARYFLAYRGKRVVGRVAAIINWTEVRSMGLPKMRFGWFDFEDDPEISKALLEEVARIGKQHGLEYMEGPVGFSNLDKVGVLTEGFDHIGTMVTWYNHAYYPAHLEALGFTPEKEFVESKFPAANADPKLFDRLEGLIRKRYNLRPLNFTRTEEIMPWVDQMFELFNSTYARLSSFVPISEAQKEYFKKKYLNFINPEYIKFIVDAQDRLVAFAVVMPSFSRALQKARGKLFPMGIFHLLRARKHNRDAIFYLIGILPEYQNKGLTSIIFNEYYQVFQKRKVEMCYRTPELADNIAIQQMWKHFDPVVYKRRKTYRKPL